MDVHALVLQLLQALIELGIAVLVPMVIKWVFTKISLGNLVKYKSLAQFAVAAVEQTMKEAHMGEKKAAAEKKLSDLTKGALRPEEIDHLVEDAVFTLKQQIGHSVAQIQRAPEKAPIGFVPKEPAAK